MEGFHAEMRDGALVINGETHATQNSHTMTPQDVADYCGFHTKDSVSSMLSLAVKKGALPADAIGWHPNGGRGYNREAVTAWQDARVLRRENGDPSKAVSREKPEVKRPELNSEYIVRRLIARMERGHKKTTIADLCTALHGTKHWPGAGQTIKLFKPAVLRAIEEGAIIRRAGGLSLPKGEAVPSSATPPGIDLQPAGVNDETAELLSAAFAIRAAKQRIAGLEQCLAAEKATLARLIDSL